MKNVNPAPDTIIAADGIMVLDRQRQIIVFNEAARRITGFAESDVLFKHYRLLFEYSPSHGSYLEEALTRGDSFSNLSLELANADLVVKVGNEIELTADDLPDEQEVWVFSL